MGRKKIFLSYANDAMSSSLKEIGRQARRLRIFDEVLLYTPKDLPSYIKDHPLLSYSRGAGYWCWKPVLIDETLKRNEEGTVVVYVDAGCTLRKSSEWKMFFSLMDRYDTLLFQYQEYLPQWEKWGSGSALLKYWTKAGALHFLDSYLGASDYHDVCQIWAGLVFMKGKSNSLLEKWKGIVLDHPEVIVDPIPEEMQEQAEGYAGHRHDQSVLSALAYYDSRTLILPEISEQYTRDAFVYASRIRARKKRNYLMERGKGWARRAFGEKVYVVLKRLGMMLGYKR